MQVRSEPEGVVQFEGLLRSKTRQSGRNADRLKRIADMRVDKSQVNAILWPAGDWSVVTRAGGDLAVLTIDLVRAPVKANRGIETAV